MAQQWVTLYDSCGYSADMVDFTVVVSECVSDTVGWNVSQWVTLQWVTQYVSCWRA